jgi:ferredoxin
MKITVEMSRCCGAGHCVLSAPEVFDQRDSDGLVILLQENPDESQQPNVRLAAELCPAQAIQLST